MPLGERIADLRSARGLTQTDLAHELGITRGALSLYEINKRQPDNDTLKKLADYFDVSVDYLLGRSEIKNEDKISEAIENDPELLEFYEEMKERENLKLLLKQTRMMDENGIRQVLRIIKAIQDEEDANS